MKLLHGAKRAQLTNRGRSAAANDLNDNPLLFLFPGNGSLAARDQSGALSVTGSGAVRYAPAPGALINLIRNPSAAVSAGNTWIGTTGGSASRTTDTVLGATAHRIAATSSVNSGTIFWGSASVPGVAKIRDKVAHTFAADVALVSGTANWQVMFYELDAAGTVLGAALGGVLITPTAGGIRVLASYTPTANGVHSVCPGFRHLDASASELDVRAATLVEGTYTELSHFDGSTGGVWLDPITGILGTANASPSVSQAVAWVEEGTTNLIPDPLTNNNPTGSQIRGAGTNVLNTDYGRSTAFARTGTGAWWRSGDGTNALRGLQQSTAAGLGYTGSVRTFSGRCQVRVTGGPYSVVGAIQIRYTDATFSSSVVQTTTVGDAWTEFQMPSLSTNSAKTVDYIMCFVYFNGTAGAGVTLYWTDIQIEERAYCSSLCAGSIGTGYAWSGTAHASSSTRTKMTLSGAPNLSSAKGAVAAKVQRIGSGYPNVVFLGGYSGGDLYHGLYVYTDGNAYSDLSHNSGASYAYADIGAFTAGSWRTLFSGWSFAQDEVSGAVNTTAPVMAAIGFGDPGDGDFPDAVYIGGDYAGNVAGQQFIGPVLIADRPLTSRERTILNGKTAWHWNLLRDAA